MTHAPHFMTPIDDLNDVPADAIHRLDGILTPANVSLLLVAFDDDGHAVLRGTCCQACAEQVIDQLAAKHRGRH